MNLVFLIGMPFAGKSYWAKALSQQYGIPYVDTDVLIEEQAGHKIAYLFETEGEATFRERERYTLHKLISTHARPAIIACGGGTPVFFDNMALMKKEGCVIYLQATVETLTARFESIEERNERPLLASVDDIEEEFEEILAKRKNIYEQAHHILPVEQLSVTSFAQIISVCIDRH